MPISQKINSVFAPLISVCNWATPTLEIGVTLFSKKPKKGFKEFLLEMPEGGDDSIFERHTSQPRFVSL
jgi:hypothetical protein